MTDFKCRSEFDEVIQISSSISELLSRGCHIQKQDSEEFPELIDSGVPGNLIIVVNKLNQNDRVDAVITSTGAFEKDSIVTVAK